MIPWIEDDEPLPRPDLALGTDSEAAGLLAASRSLSSARLEEAYRQGVFPWFSAGQPVLWWAPDPRMVLPVAAFKVSRSLRKTLRGFKSTPGCEIRVDHDVGRVIGACAQAPRQGQDGTWIVPAMAHAYTAWHRARRVHSIETWVDGTLCGGLYCVAIGRMVFGESMFARRSDASKIALAALVAFCRAHGVTLIDCQQNTRHLASLGAHAMPRSDFTHHLRAAVQVPDIIDWTYHPGYWDHLGLDAATPDAIDEPTPTHP